MRWAASVVGLSCRCNWRYLEFNIHSRNSQNSSQPNNIGGHGWLDVRHVSFWMGHVQRHSRNHDAYSDHRFISLFKWMTKQTFNGQSPQTGTRFYRASSVQPDKSRLLKPKYHILLSDYLSCCSATHPDVSPSVNLEATSSLSQWLPWFFSLKIV